MEKNSYDTKPQLKLSDPKDFEEIYKLYYSRLYLFAKNFVNNEDAEDLVTEVFLKLFKMKDTLEVRNIESFLFTTIRHSAISLLRHLNYKTAIENKISMLLTDTENSYFQDDLKAMYLEKITREVEKLPEKCKKVFKLAYFNDLKNNEIAELLNYKEQTVSNLKSQAIKLLRMAVAGKKFTPSFILCLLYMK